MTPNHQPVTPTPPPAGRLRDGVVQSIASSVHDELTESLEDVLRWLARTQLVDGSWNDNIEQTSAALLAFLRHGHTTRVGNFRQIVKRAFSWLESQSVPGKNVFIQALALAELARATLQPAHEQAAASVRAGLPAPTSTWEKTILACLEQKAPPPLMPKTEVNNLDDLRLLAILQVPVKLSPALLQGKESDLVRTWIAVLK